MALLRSTKKNRMATATPLSGQERTSAVTRKVAKGGLRKRAGGGGRKGKYLFTGLLVCDACAASFVLQNREYYCCASHWNGASCTNTIKVPRKLVQEIILGGIREDLADPEVIAEVEKRARALVRDRRRGPKANHGKRIAELRREIGNLLEEHSAQVRVWHNAEFLGHEGMPVPLPPTRDHNRTWGFDHKRALEGTA
jgi:hypothetical protein